MYAYEYFSHPKRLQYRSVFGLIGDEEEKCRVLVQKKILLVQQDIEERKLDFPDP